MLEEVGGEMEEDVLDKYKVTDSKREACRGRGARWNGGVYEEARNTVYKSGEKSAEQESSPCSESTTCSVSNACMKIPRKKKK